ncbi:uncharacterized protein LOC130096823 [Rhinichthys klamathensis goyatoka]|uniref:uncharacterized protein LOC130096823 n=1 Tax=Rhinichthys klamathensis goyatoka TaxID=3034132 RepID=UPI0024B48B0F|nr:uncharacterized protein LOC130096823 [Rhinichthys klamathensis goyatoka]
MFLIPVMLLLQLGLQDAVRSTSSEIQREIKIARLQESFTLNCTYNCSSGFARGYWKWEETPVCSKCHWNHKTLTLGDMCTVSIYTAHLIMEQTHYNYSCFSEESDKPGIPWKTELLVTLQVHDESKEQVTPPTGQADLGPSLRVESYRGQVKSDEVLTSFSTIEVMAGTSLILHCVAIEFKHCEVQWVRENSTLPLTPKNDSVIQWSEIKGEDSGRYRCQTKGTCTKQAFTVDIEVNTIDGFTWAKVFAAFAVSAVVVLTAHLVYLCYRRGCKIMDSTNIVHERDPSRNAVVMRPIAQDSQSDHEVPYADIVISVRGSSNPDLSDTFTQTSKNQRPRWRDEARAGLLHASADRLHIHSKEVTRKLSTTSEYAVITYSSEALS